MPIFLAYGIVVIVWSTTPLAIQLSNSSTSFITAVSLRMLLGAAIALAANKLWGSPLRIKSLWRSYAAGSIGFFAALLCVYWAAQFITSGLIAVIYGTAPIISGVLAWLLLGERSLTPVRIAMLMLAIVGLGIIFHSEFNTVTNSTYLIKGIGGVLASTLLFSLSAVLIKREQQAGRAPAHPLTQTAGALGFTAIGYCILWLGVLAINPSVHSPLNINLTSASAIAYLAVMGSVIGFLCYFYVLQKISAQSLALITLITPILALSLGYFAANEPISINLAIGTAVIIIALGVYQRAQPPQANTVISPPAPSLPQSKRD